MKNDVSEIRSTLNDLIETCKDSDLGFREAAEKMKNAEIHTLFLNISRERAHFAGELQAEVTRLGGEPATSGTTAGAIHRGWIGLKSALTGDNEHSILEEAERGEDAAVKNYREALAKDLPADLHGIVSQQYRSVQQAHNRVRDLRDRGNFETPAPLIGAV